MEISIENFKSIGERVNFKITPITILIGPNAAGKSTFLEAIALLSQSIKSDYLIPHGSLVSYARFEDMIHKNDITKSLNFSITIPFAYNEEIFNKFKELKLLIDSINQVIFIK